MFSWKSEAVLYSDHDRCYLFIPKQARLPPPPLVYLSATLAPLSSPSPSFQPRFIYPHLHLSLSLSSAFSSFLEWAAPPTSLAPSFTKLIGSWKSRIRTAVELAYRKCSAIEQLEGERLNYSRGKRYSDPACRFLRALFRNGLVDGIGFIPRYL